MNDWFKIDKLLHFSVSFILSFGIAIVLNILFNISYTFSIIIAFCTTLIIGIMKELWDLSGHGDPSWKDLIADTVGNITGLLLFLIINTII